jgi:hypothetical protein
MFKKLFAFGIAAVLAGIAAANELRTSQPDWHMNATIIEACSCPMFCQCFFNTKPANHAGHAEHTGHAGHGKAEHFCRANNAFKVNRGHYGDVKLDDLRFWVSGDLGDDFSDGEVEWTVLTFDRSASPEQREAVLSILPHLYPFQSKSFSMAEGTIDQWRFDKDTAVATLDGGKTAEVRLRRATGMTDEPVVIRNLPYMGAPRNDGFILMPNEVQAYRIGDKAFEFKGTNGFLITVDIGSKDVAAAAAKSAPGQ